MEVVGVGGRVRDLAKPHAAVLSRAINVLGVVESYIPHHRADGIFQRTFPLIY